MPIRFNQCLFLICLLYPVTAHSRDAPIYADILPLESARCGDFDCVATLYCPDTGDRAKALFDIREDGAMPAGWTEFIQHATRIRRDVYGWELPKNAPNDALYRKNTGGQVSVGTSSFNVSTAFIRNMPDYGDHTTDHIFIFDEQDARSGAETLVAIAKEILTDVTASDSSSYENGRFFFREEYYGSRNRSMGPVGISVTHEWRKKADSTQRTKLEYSKYCWNKAPRNSDVDQVCATDINGNTYYAKEYPIQFDYQCSAGTVNGWNIKNKAKYPIVFNYVSIIEIRQPVIPKIFPDQTREGGALVTDIIRKISVALPTSRGDIPVPSKKATPKF